MAPYCVEVGISVSGTGRSQKEPYQKNIGDEEGFQIHIQSQQSWQLETCGQGRCPARAEYPRVSFSSFLRFPGVATPGGILSFFSSYVGPFSSDCLVTES